MKNQLLKKLNKLDADITALKSESLAKEKEVRQWFLMGLADPSFAEEGYDKLKKEAFKLKVKLSTKIKEANRVERMVRSLGQN